MARSTRLTRQVLEGFTLPPPLDRLVAITARRSGDFVFERRGRGGPLSLRAAGKPGVHRALAAPGTVALAPCLPAGLDVSQYTRRFSEILRGGEVAAALRWLAPTIALFERGRYRVRAITIAPGSFDLSLRPPVAPRIDRSPRRAASRPSVAALDPRGIERATELLRVGRRPLALVAKIGRGRDAFVLLDGRHKLEAARRQGVALAGLLVERLPAPGARPRTRA